MSAPGISHLTDAQLSELTDGALAGDERATAELHLKICEQCRRELADARSLVVIAREARGGVTAPPDLWPLVAATTIHAARLRRHVLRSMRGVLIAGAVALVVATAVLSALAVGWLARPPAPVESARAEADARRAAADRAAAAAALAAQRAEAAARGGGSRPAGDARRGPPAPPAPAAPASPAAPRAPRP